MMWAVVARAEVRIVGSDLIGIEFTRELLAFTTARSQTVALALDGSRRGLEELKAGRADVALLLSPPTTDALEPFTALPIGYHAVIVAVPSSCPLNEITLPKLARAFGAEAKPGPAHWHEVGVAGDWSAGLMIPIAPQPGHGIIADFFRHSVLGGGEWKPVTRRYALPSELSLQFSGETKPIALVAHARELPEGTKILAVATHAQHPACLPSAENLHAGAYPLRLPLRVAFRRERAGELRDLLGFFFSDAAAGRLDEAGIIPLPAAARERERVALEEP